MVERLSILIRGGGKDEIDKMRRSEGEDLIISAPGGDQRGRWADQGNCPLGGEQEDEATQGSSDVGYGGFVFDTGVAQ